MCVHFRAKFQVCSVILTSFGQGRISATPTMDLFATIVNDQKALIIVTNSSIADIGEVWDPRMESDLGTQSHLRWSCFCEQCLTDSCNFLSKKILPLDVTRVNGSPSVIFTMIFTLLLKKQTNVVSACYISFLSIFANSKRNSFHLRVRL